MYPQSVNFDALARFLAADKSASTPLGVSEIIKGVEGFAPSIGGAVNSIGAGLQQNAAAVSAQRARDDQLKQEQASFAERNKRFGMLYDSLFKPIEMRNNQTGTAGSISPILLALSGQLPFGPSPMQNYEASQWAAHSPQMQQLNGGWRSQFQNLPVPLGGIPQLVF